MRILFVSNRLPIVLEKTEDQWSSHTASGGLVTALAPILRHWRESGTHDGTATDEAASGIWIGWPGVSDLDPAQLNTLLEDFSRREGYRVAPVPLTTQDYERFYQGFCNEIIWPLFHDLQSFCNFVPEYWTSSQKVEQTFADIVQKHAHPEDLIWVHDYHLMGLGRALIKRGLTNKIAFFLHIPFPPPDIFCKLPWRMDVLKGLLNYHVIGFQTFRDLENFADCVHRLLPSAERPRQFAELSLEFDGRHCAAGVFPIGIDFDEFALAADSPSVEQRVEELRPNFGGRQIILGVDRLDYTKGIPYRLRSFGQALEKYPDLHKNVTLLQVVVPSRENVPEYQNLKAEIERLVAQINGKFTIPGWVPIHHVFRHVERQELLAWYRLADVGLVTPLKDGMNLVAKEYCACQVEGNGVLVLSEFAGAAEQLGRSAVLVNPYDIDCVAAAIQLAVIMTPEERRPAMERLRANIREENVYWWLNKFLAACGVNLNHREHRLPEVIAS